MNSDSSSADSLRIKQRPPEESNPSWLEMVKVAGVSRYFAFRQRLIENKTFLVDFAKARTEQAREKLVKSASPSQLLVLKDLVLNIAEKNIEIDKHLFQYLQKKKKVKDLTHLISRIKRSPEVPEKKLRLLLFKFNSVLPCMIKSVLQWTRTPTTWWTLPSCLNLGCKATRQP